MAKREVSLSAGDVEMIKMRWDEFKYRHSHYWDLFFKFSFAILFLLAVPYLYPEEIKKLSTYILLFPAASMLMCFIATWLLAAEYERLKQVSKKLNEITPEKYLPDRFEPKGLVFLLKMGVGTFVNLVFLIGFMSLSIFEFIVFYGG